MKVEYETPCDWRNDEIRKLRARLAAMEEHLNRFKEICFEKDASVYWLEKAREILKGE